ncbi:MAG: hypothetical protein HUK06_01475 [Bacteroidaceae bacterium]|nr:hypothetical protein [Bacteroidaceae bacterium]
MEKQDKLKTLIGLMRQKCTQCNKSITNFEQTTDDTDVLIFIRTFLRESLLQIPEEIKDFCEAYYAEFKDEFNLAGIFYNESPSTSINATVLIGDSEDDIVINNNEPRVYIIGKAKVILYGKAKCECLTDCANIIAKEESKVVFDGGHVIAEGRSSVFGKGNVTCSGATSISLGGGIINDNGHRNIIADGDTIVNSFTNRNMKLYGNAKLNLR